jgi:hypothetical protein
MSSVSATYRATDGSPVLALSLCGHPLSYPNFLAKQRHEFGPNPTAKHDMSNGLGSNVIQHHNGVKSSSLSAPKSDQEKLLYMFERQKIVDLLCAYAYTLDCTMMDLKVAHDWANLFTDDCVLTYPFGTHSGKAGLADFGMAAESRFTRMLVSSWPRLKPQSQELH